VLRIPRLVWVALTDPAGVLTAVAVDHRPDMGTARRRRYGVRRTPKETGEKPVLPTLSEMGDDKHLAKYAASPAGSRGGRWGDPRA